jgi:hypothetical protein
MGTRHGSALRADALIAAVGGLIGGALTTIVLWRLLWHYERSIHAAQPS